MVARLLNFARLMPVFLLTNRPSSALFFLPNVSSSEEFILLTPIKVESQNRNTELLPHDKREQMHFGMQVLFGM